MRGCAIALVVIASVAQAKGNHRVYRAEALSQVTRIDDAVLPAGAIVTYASPPHNEAGAWVMVSAASPSNVAVCGVALASGAIHFRQRPPYPPESSIFSPDDLGDVVRGTLAADLRADGMRFATGTAIGFDCT